MASFLSRLNPWKTKQNGGTDYWLPISGGWLPSDAPLNWWQSGYDVMAPSTRSAMVEACVSAYSQTVAMCPGDHWRTEEDGGRTRVTTSALARILRKPNGYQSISDFLLNATRSLYVDGNTYALALRNDRFEINELHLMHPRSCLAQVAENGEVFYSLGGNEIIDRRFGRQPFMVPSRDVLHIRLHSSRDMLKGESPLWSAMLDVAANNAMTAQQIAYYNNQARPSFVLGTDQVLTLVQAQEVRERWNEQSKGLNAGGTPILTAGLKPMPLSVSASDNELAEVMKLTEQHIALAFRIPLQMLGMSTGTGSTFSSTESLMQFWLASGLSFCLNHIEEAIGQLFNLRGQPDEYLEFDTGALLRSNHKDRIEALARGVISGIMSPNEARASEGLPAVEFGEEPRVQQQVVPLSAASGIPSAPGPESAPGPADVGEEPEDEAEDASGAKDYVKSILAAADEYDRVA